MGDGEFVAVMGPSGRGKSTLLNIIAGLDRPDEGTIEVAGERIDGRGGRRRPARAGTRRPGGRAAMRMTAAWTRLEWPRRWRSLTALALLVALSTATVLAPPPVPSADRPRAPGACGTAGLAARFRCAEGGGRGEPGGAQPRGQAGARANGDHGGKRGLEGDEGNRDREGRARKVPLPAR